MLSTVNGTRTTTSQCFPLMNTQGELKMAQTMRLVWEAAQGIRRKVERFTKRQMGDAGEMLIAAELTLHGIPAFILPRQWRGYDVVAQCPERGLQRVSVKTRNFARYGNFVSYNPADKFDWLAIVILPATSSYRRRIFIAPRGVADRRSYENPQWNGQGFHVHKLIGWPTTIDCGLADYEDNFSLSLAPVRKPRTH